VFTNGKRQTWNGIDNKDIGPAPITHHPVWDTTIDETLALEAADEAGFDPKNGDIWIVDVSDDTKNGESVNWVFKPHWGNSDNEKKMPSVWARNDGSNWEISNVIQNGEVPHYALWRNNKEVLTQITRISKGDAGPIVAVISVTGRDSEGN